MKVLEVWTGEQWSKLRLREDGQPVYVSNGALVGNGMRVTRVSDENQPPVAGDLEIGNVPND